MNKNFLGFVLALCTCVLANSASAASCSRNGDGEITGLWTTGNTLPAACTVTPDEVYFPIYKFGFCEEAPTYANYLTACDFIYDNTDGSSNTIASDATFSLVDSISLAEGTYEAVVLLIGNEIGVKHNERFAVSQLALDSDGNDAEGKNCSTRADTGSEDDFASNLDCDTDQIEAGMFLETDGAYVVNVGGGEGRCTISSGQIDSDISFSTSSGTTVVCGMLNAEAQETYTSGATNAERQLVVQSFSSPVSITGQTSGIDIAFKLTDMLSIEQNWGKDGSGNDEVGDKPFIQAYLDGFEIKVDVE